MNCQGLTENYWSKLTIEAQMANIGAEVGRAINWRKKDAGLAQGAFYRALELLVLTKSDPKNKTRLKEICRVNELLVDWWYGSQEYGVSDGDWEKYFYSYNYACRRDK